MIGEKIQDPEQIKKILNASVNENHTLFMFFLTFTFSILISTFFNMTDLALLLPEHGVKIPLIDFELNLLDFFILAPTVLLLLHFKILFNHYKHLEKLYTYKDEVDIKDIQTSHKNKIDFKSLLALPLYSFALIMGNHSFSGRMINFILWILLYFLPLLVFLIIYIRFADYHHEVITPLHLIIIILDLIFIVSSIVYNDIFYKNEHFNHYVNTINTILKYFVFIVFIFIGILMVLYFVVFFYPITYKEYNPSYLKNIKNDYLPKIICSPISLIISEKKKLHCYPRLIVTDEVMAKFSPEDFYVRRHLSMANIKEELKEQELILKYGKRIDLSNRNLRYAYLQNNILTRADMTNSQLDAADLRGSQMQAVDLTDASFIDANLIQAKLQSSELVRTQLQGAILVSAQMQNAFLVDSNLSNAQMQDTNLSNAQFLETDLNGVDFREATLEIVNFFDSNLTGASLHNANITNSFFQKSNLTATDFSGVLFDKGDSRTPYFKDAKMFGVNISKNKKQDLNLTECQKQFIFDSNVHNKYFTFHGRRIKYLHTIIQEIYNQNPMKNCKSQKKIQEKLTKLKNISNTSCEHLKNEASIFNNTLTMDIYKELMEICNP